MKKAIVFLPLLLSACFTPVTRDQQLKVYRNRCYDYGYQPGTLDFADCMREQEAHEETLTLSQRKASALEQRNQIEQQKVWQMRDHPSNGKAHGRPTPKKTKKQPRRHSPDIMIDNSVHHFNYEQPTPPAIPQYQRRDHIVDHRVHPAPQPMQFDDFDLPQDIIPNGMPAAPLPMEGFPAGNNGFQPAPQAPAFEEPNFPDVYVPAAPANPFPEGIQAAENDFHPTPPAPVFEEPNFADAYVPAAPGGPSPNPQLLDLGQSDFIPAAPGGPSPNPQPTEESETGSEDELDANGKKKSKKAQKDLENEKDALDLLKDDPAMNHLFQS